MTRWVKITLAIVVGVPMAAYVVGAVMPRDHVARMSIDLTSPPDRVWALIADFEGAARWRTDISAVHMKPAGPPILVDGAPAVKASALRFTESSPQGEIEFVVERQTPPTQQVVRIVDDEQPFGGTWTWDLEATASGTHLTITERGFVKNPLFRVMGAIFFSPTDTMEAYLRALAKALGETAEPREVR